MDEKELQWQASWDDNENENSENWEWEASSESSALSSNSNEEFSYVPTGEKNLITNSVEKEITPYVVTKS